MVATRPNFSVTPKGALQTVGTPVSKRIETESLETDNISGPSKPFGIASIPKRVCEPAPFTPAREGGGSSGSASDLRPKSDLMSGNRSTVATHPNLAEIELALANNISVPKIADKFNVGRYAVYRYKARMTPERLTLLRYRRGDSPIDLERLKQGEAESTVQRNVTMMAELWQLYRLAAEAGDHQVAIQAAREYRRYNELQAKLVGELVTADRHLHLNVTDSPAAYSRRKSAHSRGSAYWRLSRPLAINKGKRRTSAR